MHCGVESLARPLQAAIATEKTALLKAVDNFTDDTTVLTYDPMAFTHYGAVMSYQGTIFAQKVRG